MSKRESISRYNIIIKKLRKYPATFEEIHHELELESEIHSYNFMVSKRTFQRDLNDIRSIYGIDIQYSRRRGKYYIDSNDQSPVSARILEAFDTLTALNIVDNLSDSIMFEARKTSGSEYMYGLIHAVKNSQLVKIVYQKFTEESASIRELEPYALKEHMNRWYLMAVDRKDNRLKSFAFDRIHDLVPTNVRFSKNDDINVEEIYQDCFGIINPNGNPTEEVILSFTAHQGKYIKSLPLHHSQELIQETETEMVFKLNIVITEDFVMELLSHSNRVEVLQPEHLKDRLLWHYNKAIELYS